MFLLLYHYMYHSRIYLIMFSLMNCDCKENIYFSNKSVDFEIICSIKSDVIFKTVDVINHVFVQLLISKVCIILYLIVSSLINCNGIDSKYQILRCGCREYQQYYRCLNFIGHKFLNMINGLPIIIMQYLMCVFSVPRRFLFLLILILVTISISFLFIVLLCVIFQAVVNRLPTVDEYYESWSTSNTNNG